jgi:phosphoglycolate phosphatase-like HAD superfamily hydrolase
MVLMAAALSCPEPGLEALLSGYSRLLSPLLARWGWSSAQLQQALEQVRSDAIRTDLPAWLALHRFYPGVVERLRQLEREGVTWMVLTTKGEAFARQILRAEGLEPAALHGHEQGSKPEVLKRLLAHHTALWFVEDRRPTLEQVRADPALAPVRCFLASWGYLAPEDGVALPMGIHWLEPERFAAPLAQWP